VLLHPALQHKTDSANKGPLTGPGEKLEQVGAWHAALPLAAEGTGAGVRRAMYSSAVLQHCCSCAVFETRFNTALTHALCTLQAGDKVRDAMHK
jgi:hypothetical protein